MEAVMRTYYLFQSGSSAGLRGFTEDASGKKLPPEDGPWSLLQKVEPDEQARLHRLSNDGNAVSARSL